MSGRTHSLTSQKLAEHRNAMQRVHLRTLFEDDAKRFDKFSVQLEDLLFDYSKHRITAETVALLIELAEQTDVPQFIESLFRDELEDSSDVSTRDSSTNALFNYYKRLRTEGSK